MTFATFARDARHAVRMLLRTPGFTLVAVLTFALGIGVNTAVFSVFNGVLLRPLPYPDPDRITLLWMDNRREGIREDITSYPNFLDWRDQSASYAVMAAYTPTAFNLTGAGEPERLEGAQATAAFFAVMGVQPVLGQLFTDAHETPGHDAVVVLSEGLWQRRFGGGPDAIGRTITLNGRAHEIVGVLPAALQVPAGAALWKPLAPPEQVRAARSSYWLPVIGRLRPGVSAAEAQAEMDGIAARLEETYPSNRGFGINVVPLERQLVGDIERTLVVLLAAVGFVLLIACANLSNLMLGRAAARRKELAIRTALGAGRGRLVAQMITEALVLAMAGSTLGLLLAFWATDAFLAIGGDTIPRRDAVAIDGAVLLFTLALAVLAALVAGIVPALAASRPAVVEHLREGRREGAATASRATRNALVGAEIALAFVLLAGGGLLIRTLWTMEDVPRGFDGGRVATMRLSLPAALYPEPADVRGFYARLLDRVRTLPGVEAAATGTAVLQPLVTNSGTYSIEGQPVPPPEEQVEYPVEVVSPGYFETLGAELAAGRTFTSGDHAEAPRAVVINETLARVGWPGQDPIGRRMRAGGADSTAPWMTVVGIVKDLRRADVRRQVRPELYMCALQVTPRSQMLLVRTEGRPAAIVPSVRQEVRALDPQLPLFEVGTLGGQLSETLAPARFRAVLLGAFAAVALLLAAIGIYGVTSHAVAQRTHEVGIRMALGAHRNHLLALIVGQHLRPAVAGTAVGLAGALALSRSLRTLVYGVGVSDPLTLVAVGGLLLSVTALACVVPAWRATRLDPLAALRAD